jgi:predicted dehydrogenase
MSSDAGGVIRVAFLGIDETTSALLRAVLENRRFELAGVCEFNKELVDTTPQLRPLVDRARAIAKWEDLLEDGQIDAVVVARGRDQELRTEQLRKFVQVEKPVLAAHPVVDSMLAYYELDMIRRENNSPLVPQLPARRHPAIRALADIVQQGDDSPIGKVEHLSIERCISSPNKESVARHFARDVDLARAVAGDMTRLGAMAGAKGSPNLASLGVQMSGPAGIDARWSVVPNQSAVNAKITLNGPRGRAAVELHDEGAPCTLECVGGEQSLRQEFAGWNAAEAALDELAAAHAGRQPSPDWVDACRSIELTETIDRSLVKARTLELYYEDYTEDATFKGTMASIGCGLLLLTLCVLALAGVAEQMRIPYVGVWRYIVVAVFVVFLLVQLIMLTSGKKQPAGDRESAESNPRGPR